MIDINDITVRIGTKTLLEEASAHIADGWKVGLVGANGCGKSTLFRVLKGELETERGDVGFPSGSRVVFVEQEITGLEMPLLAYVLAQDKEQTELLARLEKAEAAEMAEIHERLNLLGASAATARAAEILNGLGFQPEDMERPVREFSGGWRMRVALAAALFQPSDILLLDEPTNHLDLESGIWLENHLRHYHGTLLIISHDRNILNSLCNYIIHFDHKRLITYSGNYDTFRSTRALQQEVRARQAEKVEQQRRHLQSFVDRFRYKASKAKQAQSRMKMLEKLETVDLIEDAAATVFNFPEPDDLPPPLLTIEDGAVGYDGVPVLKKLNLQIVDNDRIALLGANGNGKSTLAKLLSGRLPLLSGQERRLGKLRVGYFAQHQAEELPLELTALEYMTTLMPQESESKIRSHLAGFGLGQEKALTQIARLSGGEKARLLFAAMTTERPGLLILDEPTNHLDIDGREALIRALNEYKGSVILITHDIRLIELIADTLWLVKNHTCKTYDGDLEDYKKMLLDGDTFKKAPKAAPKPAEPKIDTRRQKKDLTTRLRRVERELEKLGEQKAVLENAFQHQMATEELIAKQKDLAQVENQIAGLENEWLELGNELEHLTGEK